MEKHFCLHHIQFVIVTWLGRKSQDDFDNNKVYLQCYKLAINMKFYFNGENNNIDSVIDLNTTS